MKKIILKSTPIAAVAILFTCFLACSSSSGGGTGGGGGGGAGGSSAGGGNGAGGGTGAGGGGGSSSSFACGSSSCDANSQYCALSASTDSSGNVVWSPSGCQAPPSSCLTSNDPCTCLATLDCPESGTVVTQCSISNGQLSFGCQNL